MLDFFLTHTCTEITNIEFLLTVTTKTQFLVMKSSILILFFLTAAITFRFLEKTACENYELFIFPLVVLTNKEF